MDDDDNVKDVIKDEDEVQHIGEVDLNAAVAPDEDAIPPVDAVDEDAIPPVDAVDEVESVGDEEDDDEDDDEDEEDDEEGQGDII